MAENPSIAAALRSAAAEAAGLEPNPDDVRLATYGTVRPNLAQTVGYEPQLSYDDYMRWVNRTNLPAVQASGAHFSPAGVREGYEEQGLPPVIMQRSPYATAAYRTFVDPWGQMMVQPLVGFPSAYPHVLSGVPTDFGNRIGYAMSLLGPMAQYRPSAPQAAPAPRAAAPRAAAPRNTQARPTAQPPVQPAAQPAVQPPAQMVHYGNARAKADFMPVSPENQAWLNELEQPAPQASAQPSRWFSPDIPGKPWYAPLVDDLYNMMGIRLPQLGYQPEKYRNSTAEPPKSAPENLQPPVQPPVQAAPAAPLPQIMAPASGVTVNPDGSWSEPPLEYNSPRPAPDVVPITMLPSALLKYYG